MIAQVVSVQVGKVEPLGPQDVPSAFVKRRIEGRVAVRDFGLEGDAQADLSVHGGPEKAVYAYATNHYAKWSGEYPDRAALFAPGGMGENLSVAGLEEADICVGDVHEIGDALLQVCQPRQPCFKFALRFENNQLPKAMVRNGRSGWYYRVLKTGALGAADAVLLRDRPHPEFAFSRLVSIVNFGEASQEELKQMSVMSGLATHLQQAAREALRNQEAD